MLTNKINALISQILSNEGLMKKIPALQHLNLLSTTDEGNCFETDTYNSIIDRLLDTSHYQLIMATPANIIYYDKHFEDVLLISAMTGDVESLTTGEIIV